MSRGFVESPALVVAVVTTVHPQLRGRRFCLVGARWRIGSQ